MSFHLSLPLELWDNIIDHMWSDLHMMVVFSLTCRAWLRTARIHKFRAVKLHTLSRCARLEGLVESPLLDSYDVPRHVREVRIGLDPNASATGEAEIHAFWSNSNPVRLLRMFQNMEHLRMDNLQWSPSYFPDETLQLFQAAFLQLRHLHMHVAVFHSPEDLLLILSAFPHLSSVVFSFVTWLSEEVVALWTSSPSRPSKQSSRNTPLFYGKLTTDPTSYVALLSAAAVSPNSWTLALDQLEWTGHDKLNNDWMQGRAYRQSIAFTKPFVEMTTHLYAADGFGLLDVQPRLVTSIDILHIDVASSSGTPAITSARAIGAEHFGVRQFLFTVGTIHSSSVSADLEAAFGSWTSLERYLCSVATHPQAFIRFEIQIEFDNESADCRGWVECIEESFNSRLPTLMERGTPMCAVARYSVDEWGRPGAFRKEIWWLEHSRSDEVSEL